MITNAEIKNGIVLQVRRYCLNGLHQCMGPVKDLFILIYFGMWKDFAEDMTRLNRNRIGTRIRTIDGL
jgi:hypothetical protein